MTFRMTIVFAAGLVLASRAWGAEGAGPEGSRQPQDRTERTWTERSRELGQQGADAARRGARAAGKKVNEGGQAATAKVVGTKTVDGRISGVSQDRLTVKRSDGSRIDLRVTESTQVTVGGKEGSPGALKQGDEVRASYAQSGGSATAMKIEVKRAPAPRPRAGKAEPRPPAEAAPTPGATSR